MYTNPGEFSTKFCSTHFGRVQTHFLRVLCYELGKFLSPADHIEGITYSEVPIKHCDWIIEIVVYTERGCSYACTYVN